MTQDLPHRRIELGCDVMVEGMAAIRAIASAPSCSGHKDDADRLRVIRDIAVALYTLDVRSPVAMGVTRGSLRRLLDDRPEMASMCPTVAAWVSDAGEPLHRRSPNLL